MPDVVCFGPFELDTRTGDLRKRGKRIRLAPQPALLLTLLATRPGQLVTRDEIRQHLWGGRVFVEYGRSLNACLAHLRARLGDRADAPRYIETAPRRGYRFIAPVQRWRPFPQPTVAVLPFVNLTGDPALEYFVARLDPLSESTHFQLAWCYYFGGDPAGALEQAQKTLERFPDSLLTWYVLGLSHLALGQADEAVTALEKATSLSREPVGLGYLGCAYALVGRLEHTRALIDELLARKAQRFVPLKPFILLYTALGDIDRALDALEQAYEQRDPILFAVTAVPLYARLQGHPRFEAVVARVAAHRGKARRPVHARHPEHPSKTDGVRF